ncbi:class II fructose-bisphosphatase [Paenibacillus sp. Marseille-P2973]|uniref:class II fructose-bisphosphatase n=1 Tax=Paenibacillus sp. Marseille-P2973 TaxID=1871032 RepID=UPI001B37B57D|nr:class II fructose-bisphosphatase [Paenibacillus sp. Marseille-P2973]MBQ4897738.1 class II fructose-bisphosphatase [Paenibacillus sp. Marseille-P2973]
MERHIALELARITEAAALDAACWTGRGDKHSADEAATVAIRSLISSVDMDGTVVIGEGEMDEAPMLYIGEKVGNRRGPKVDIAVDPLEGTETVANGLNNAISVIAAAPQGHLLHAPDIYMAKLAVGPALAGRLSLDDPIEVTLTKASDILSKPLSEMTVSILDRERHRDMISALRQAGVRIKLLSHGDVMGAIEAAVESEVDLYVGSGGAPEGVLAAAALRCLGGEMQGRLLPGNPEEAERCRRMGLSDPQQLLGMDEMVGRGSVLFVATGVTSGDLLSGVRYLPNNTAETHSVIMHSLNRTVSYLRTIHHLAGAADHITEAAI